MVDGLVEMHLANFKASGAELVMGEARFVEPKTVDVSLNAGGSRRLRGDRVFLGLGSRATIPPVPGLADVQPLTHVEALDLERLPDHLVVLGGGYVGSRSLPKPCVASAARSRSCSAATKYWNVKTLTSRRQLKS